MKIKNTRVIKTGDRVSIVADCKIRTVGWDTVFFSFDKKYEDFLYADSSPFTATLLIPSMYLGQDLIIEGSISETLHAGMIRIMETMAGWNIGLHKINIQAQRIVRDELEPKAVATFFSSGVDSFYTYLKHKSDTVDQISHFILICGTDIDFGNSALWNIVRENVSSIARHEGIELIDVETNVQSLLEPILSPEISHGGTLAAVGLCLRSGLKKVYIPASSSMEDVLSPWGSHPDVDRGWSTEALLFEHDGFESSRVKKVLQYVGQSPLALEHLRVCFMNVRDTYNCGKCEKCLRTMMNLYAVGKLSEAKTFPHKLEINRILEIIRTQGKICVAGFKESIEVMREYNIDPDLYDQLIRQLETVPDITPSVCEKIFKKGVYLDHMFLRGMLYQFWVKYIRDFVRRIYP